MPKSTAVSLGVAAPRESVRRPDGVARLAAAAARAARAVGYAGDRLRGRALTSRGGCPSVRAVAALAGDAARQRRALATRVPHDPSRAPGGPDAAERAPADQHRGAAAPATHRIRRLPA